MKRAYLILLWLLPLMAVAQKPYLGYISFKTILEQMPEYSQALQ